MDDQQFDQLSKSLATSVSRRQAMKILGATAAGGMAALFGARGASAHHNANCRDFDDNCRSNAECCTGACINFHCGCAEGTVICQDRCVPVCTPPRILDPDSCTCECDPAIICPPPRLLDPQTCQCACPAGTTPCGQTCCPPGTFCQNGVCVQGVPCGNELCNPATEFCCPFPIPNCCGRNQQCSIFFGCQ